MPQSFLDMLRGKMPEEKGLSISLLPNGFVDEVSNYRRLGPPQADTDALQGAMSRNELVFACLGVKSTAARDPRLLVQRAVKKGGATEYEEVQGHPFRQLIMRPNPLMTEGDLMRAAIVSWDVSNPRRFYCEKEYKGNILVALWPLNPACMSPIPSRVDRSTIGYVWSDGTHRREYSLDELLIRTAPAWYDPPPIVSALGNIDLDTAQTDTIRAFFENGGIPPGFLKYNMPLSDPQRDTLREKWADRYGNRHGRQHNVGILDVNAEWVETGASLDKLSNQMLRSVSESRICMVFGVPPLIVYAYVGLIRATYSNLKEAWSGFWDHPMSPQFKEWRDFWTWNLLTEFEDERTIRGEAIKLNYDMSQVAALQDDVDAMQARARANFQAGGMDRDEFRAVIGLPPTPKAVEKAAAPTEAPAVPILGYHIDSGTVSRNEARAQLGLPQQDDSQDQLLRRLKAVLSVVQAAVMTGIPLESALAMVNLNVPGDVTPPQITDVAKSTKARKPSLEVTQRRMEKDVQRYITAQYERAAQAVA
jgi:HK97 family phage portal protein